MAEKLIPDEKAIIEEILQRKGSSRQARIPAAKMQVFKARLNEEMERTGSLRPEIVDDLLRQLKSGDL
jgi:hypothetical protein